MHPLADDPLPGILPQKACHCPGAAVHACGCSDVPHSLPGTAVLPALLDPLSPKSEKPCVAGGTGHAGAISTLPKLQLGPSAGAPDFHRVSAGETAAMPYVGTEGVGSHL